MENVKSFEKYYRFFVEIRKRLIFTICLFLVVVVFGFIYSDRFISLVIHIFGIHGVNIVFTSPFQFINLSISISLMIGLVILFPLILLQTISFLKPALKKNEFRLMLYLLPFSILLFLLGFGFGIVIMRYIVAASYIQAVKLHMGNFLDISDLLSQVLRTATLMGVAFQFPVLLIALMKLQIIKYQMLVKNRLWAYAAAALFAGILPPADIPSTIVYFIVLVVLFEATLFIGRFLQKKDR